jgi:hypothetical protein
VAEPNQIETILKDELHAILAGLDATYGPETRMALARMAEDAALMPVRIARGENVTPLLKALNAEAQNRMLTQRIRVQEVIEQAWIRTITRILKGVLVAAL